MEPRREVCRRLHGEYAAAREKIRRAFVASALKAREEVANEGKVMAAADVHRWLLAQPGSGKAGRPRARILLR
jgi:hypothetical protein